MHREPYSIWKNGRGVIVENTFVWKSVQSDEPDFLVFGVCLPQSAPWTRVKSTQVQTSQPNPDICQMKQSEERPICSQAQSLWGTAWNTEGPSATIAT